MTNRLIRSPHSVLLSFSGVCALLILFGTVTAQGATYYVATTGSDSNPGTSDRPWRNPQRCTTSPIKAGDTCIVRSGTYTDTDGNGAVVWVYNRTTTPSGTASGPITIKSEKPLGAVIAVSSRNGLNTGFYVDKPYYVIEGFNISGGSNSGSSATYHGIYLTSSADGAVVRANSIHHIGRAVCSNSDNGFPGVFVKGTSSVLIERNRIYSIGRRRNGESGCSTTRYQHDHGIYVTGASNVTVRRNVIYDSNRGYPIHVYRGTTSNLNIYHNTLSGKSPTGKPTGHILLASTIRTANIKNNISTDAKSGMVVITGLTASGVSINYNMSNTITNAKGGSYSGVQFSNNFDRISTLGFVSNSTNDFRLVSGSPAINRGTTSGVPPVSDGAPDISAYEYAVQNNISSPLTPKGLRAL